MEPAHIGIDVSKSSLDVVLLCEGKRHYQVVENNLSGFQHLSTWLEREGFQEVHMCMEATGQYGDAAATYFYQRAYPISVVNPARIKAYAASRLTRNKTDKADAMLIAEYCLKEQPPLWCPPQAAFRTLKALVHYLDDLMAMKQQERNRLECGSSDPLVESMLLEHIAFLDEKIKDLHKAIHQHLQSDPQLKHCSELLISIPGIGEWTAARLLAEIRDFRDFKDARQLTAYAGLNPRNYQSGSSVHKKSRLSKIGNVHLRHALFMPAIVAMQHNPIIREFSLRLSERGLAKMAIVGAAMRKLLVLAYGVIKTDMIFDPRFAQKEIVGP
jgi:transposase